MKTINLLNSFGVLLLGILFSGCVSGYNAQQSPYEYDDAPITYQTFYDDLSPYGTWINYPSYGNVWRPSLGTDFRPYATNGQWIHTPDGWAWSSNYNWGWAPFHYGRWLYDDFYGWMWMPGYEWAPAWVTWGTYGDYYTWAPLMPGINASSAYGNYRPNSIYWNVVNRSNIYNNNVGNYLQRPTVIRNVQNITIINNYNRNADNRYYSRGPQAADVQRYSNRRVNTVNVRDVNRNNNVVDRNNSGRRTTTTRDNNQTSGRPTTTGTDRTTTRRTNTDNNRTVTPPAATNDNNSDEIRVYRPRVEQPATTTNRRNTSATPAPQPREVRDANSGNARPIRNQKDNVSGQRQEQAENVNRLPSRTTTTPANTNDNNRRSSGSGSRRF